MKAYRVTLTLESNLSEEAAEELISELLAAACDHLLDGETLSLESVVPV